jgi:hypothetical protein
MLLSCTVLIQRLVLFVKVSLFSASIVIVVVVVEVVIIVAAMTPTTKCNWGLPNCISGIKSGRTLVSVLRDCASNRAYVENYILHAIRVSPIVGCGRGFRVRITTGGMISRILLAVKTIPTPKIRITGERKIISNIRVRVKLSTE